MAGRLVYGWRDWRRRIDVHGHPHACTFEWRVPHATRIRSADRHWIVWNTYPGVLIGVAIGLPKLRRSRPGYPGLSILWGRPGRYVPAAAQREG